MTKSICRVCEVEKTRVRSPLGTWISRFVDDQQRPWNGLECPECKANTPLPRSPVSTRICRECNEQLPPTAYFYHTHCRVASYGDVDDLNEYTRSTLHDLSGMPYPKSFKSLR